MLRVRGIIRNGTSLAVVEQLRDAGSPPSRRYPHPADFQRLIALRHRRRCLSDPMLFENLHGVALKVRNPPLALIVGGEADLEWGPEDVVDTHYIGYRDRSCVRTPSGAGGCRRTESRCGCRSIRRRGWWGMYR